MKYDYNKVKKIYITLIFTLILLFTKFIFDFIIYSPVIKNTKKNTNFKIEKNMIHPRFQSNIDGLTYIEAKIGYLDEQENYILKDAILKSNYGNAVSGNVKILKNKNNFIFTESPTWKINIDKIQNKQKLLKKL